MLKLIRAKRERDWKPSIEELRKGFRGWHQRGYLPHFDAPHVTQMVTFLLADSFPAQRRVEWEPILREPDDSIKRRKLEAWLDRGQGECWLRRPEIAATVEQVLRKGDGREFRLQAWVIMPNHVHLVVDVWDVPLAPLERISFQGAVDAARPFGEALLRARTRRQRGQLLAELLRVLAADPVPKRPGRHEPRALKRRPKRFPRLNRARALFVEPPRRVPRKKSKA